MNELPSNILTQLVSAAKRTLETFDNIRNFDPTDQNPGERRDSLIKSVADQYKGLFEIVSPVIAYSESKAPDFKQIEQNARKSLNEIHQIQQRLEVQSKQIITDTQSTLNEVKKAAAQVGVAQHAIHFKIEADNHIKRSKWWLISTIGLWILTGGFGIWCFKEYARTDWTEITTAQSLQLAISKLVIFSILYLAAFWSGRIFKSQWHNYVVNRHRQNALNTFETFVKAAGDQQTKDAVLLQATQSIFAPQSTGYLSNESEAPQSPQILEIIRSVTGARG